MGKTEELETLITALEKEHKKLREMQGVIDTDCISRQAAVDYCKKMLIETALNNVGFICNADELLLDIEENRIETWLSHVPPAQPKRGRWILDRSGAYCCSECMEPCAGYVMMKPRDKFCKMCGSRNEVTE